MIQPLGNRIVVKENDKSGERMVGSLIIKESNEDSRHKEGTVLACGPGRLVDLEPRHDSVTGTSTFTLAPMQVRVGDTIIFAFGEEYTIEGQKVYIINELDVLAKLTK